MAHFGVLCPDMSGHLNPAMSLSRELQRRGHQVTFYQRLITEKRVADAGFNVRTFAADVFPISETKAQLAKLATLSSLKGLQFTVKLICKRSEACLREVPAMIKADGIDAMLVDQVTPEGAVIAQELDLPYATLCNALMLHREPAVPPFFTRWPFRDHWWWNIRNRFLYMLMRQLGRPLMRVLNDHRRSRGFRKWREIFDAHSPSLQLSQQPREFEFPRRGLPETFHFTGPWIDPAAREANHFPYDKLDGRPLIYASTGTLQNRRFYIYENIAAGCEGLDAQLVIALGGVPVADAPKFAGDPIVVEHAPQLDLLSRAALCITHAGLNTTLESLSMGVPMVAIPITNDQPAVASRVVWSGAGLMFPLKTISPERVRETVQRVLSESSFRENAQRLQRAIQEANGLMTAADLIESRLLNGHS